MKFNKLIYAAIGAVLTFGLFGGALLSSSATEVKEAKATDTSDTVTFQIKESDEGGVLPGADYVYVYLWIDGTGTNNGWPGQKIATTVSGSENTYQFSLTQSSTTYDSFIVTFYDSNNSDPWSQTSDAHALTALGASANDYTYVIYTNTNTEAAYSGWEYTGETTTFTSDYLRIWVNRGDYTDGYITLLHYTANGNDVYIHPTGYQQIVSNGSWLAYYDVSKDIIGNTLTFEVFASSGAYIGSFSSETGSETYASGDNAQIYYIWDVNEGDGTYSYHYSLGTLDEATFSVPVENLKPVFEGYFTCSSDLDNGYGNFAQFVSTWIKYTDDYDNECWRTIGNLSDLYLDDFANEADYATGTRTTNSTDAYSKYETMLASYESTSASGVYTTIDNSDSATIIIILSILVPVTLLTAIFLIYRSRKTKVSK